MKYVLARCVVENQFAVEVGHLYKVKHDDSCILVYEYEVQLRPYVTEMQGNTVPISREEFELWFEVK